jgi:hypothetical protein
MHPIAVAALPSLRRCHNHTSYHFLQVRWLNRMLDLCHWYLLSARVMLTQHSAALHALESRTSSSGGGGGGSAGHSRGEPVVAGAATAEAKSEVLHYHEPGHKVTDPSQPYMPPHQQLVDSKPVSLIQRQAPIMQAVQDVVEDCRCVDCRCGIW